MTVKVVGWELARICAAFSHLFVNLINTRVRHPVDYKHTEHWGCGNPKQRVLCKQKTSNAPSPSPFPFSHHGQASNSRACPWVRKGEGGRGWGIVFCCPHTMGSPCGVWERAKKWGAFRHLFVNLISTTVRHPVDYKHTEDWVCGNPKQRVLCKQKKTLPHPLPPSPFLTMGRPATQEPAHG